MPIDRRRFLSLMASGAVASRAVSTGRAPIAGRPKIRAIAFDGYTVFDPRPAAAVAESLFPGRAAELTETWRTRQFEYAWLRTLTGRYADFWQVTEEALVFAARMLKFDLSRQQRRQLMQAHLELKAWPDALPALRTLKEAGIRMAFLSNFTTVMLDAAVKSSGLEGIFEAHLSTDQVRAFKPDPRAYRMGIDAFGMRREEIGFAAFGGWDAAGATSFGYPTFWVNRANLPVEELGVSPDATGATLHDLVRFVRSTGSG